MRFRPPLPSTAPYPNAESTHVRASSSPAQTRPGSEREIVLQPFYLSPAPVVAVINPTGPFRLLSLRRQQTAVSKPTLSLRRQRVVVVVSKKTTTTVPFLVVFPYPSFFSLSLRVNVCLPLFGCLQPLCVGLNPPSPPKKPPCSPFLPPIVTQPRGRTVGNTCYPKPCLTPNPFHP